jgi:hypothetical protein
MNVAVIYSVVRHLLSAGGAVLVAIGVTTPEEVNLVSNAVLDVIGGIAFLTGVLWGVFEKVFR